MGFRYNTAQESEGFDYENPISIDAFSINLLHLQNQRNKPFLSDYISSRIMEYINPPLEIPELSKELNLLDRNTIDPKSPIIKCGYMTLNSDGTIDTNSFSVKDGYVNVMFNGKINKKCKAYKDALKRYNKKNKEKYSNISINQSMSAFDFGGSFYAGNSPSNRSYSEKNQPNLIYNSDGTIDPYSRSVQNGEVRLKKDGTIDKRSKAVRNGTIKFNKDGTPNRNTTLFRRKK